MKKTMKLVLGFAAAGVLLMGVGAGIVAARTTRTWQFPTFVLDSTQTMTSAAAETHTGAVTFSTSIKPPYPATQTIAAQGTVAADACGGVKRITAASVIASSTTHTFAIPSGVTPPCPMDVYNDGFNQITLKNNSEFMSAGAADVVLGSSDTLRVFTNGTVWIQVGATGNN